MKPYNITWMLNAQCSLDFISLSCQSTQVTKFRTSVQNHLCPCPYWSHCYPFDLDLNVLVAWAMVIRMAATLTTGINVKNGRPWWHQCLDRLSVVSGDWHCGLLNALRKKNYTNLALKIVSTWHMSFKRHQQRELWEILERKRASWYPWCCFMTLYTCGSRSRWLLVTRLNDVYLWPHATGYAGV